ncbi:MAG: shikimate dehydrogenase [Akkermansiaceae bacterium]|nr:shikimate dehydrogenase [Akkermansiaceae bacterium]
MKPFHTLGDLVSRDVLDAGHAKPAKLAVLGFPIAHSASPRMHQPALDALGIDARYIRLEVEPGKIPEAFERMRELGFIGCNVTVPHKLEALDACDEVDPEARELGAVNTVRFDAGATRGWNTDGPGFAAAVEEEFGAKLGDLSVAILGAGGGAGMAIATFCALRGSPRIVLANRTVEKLAPLADRLRALAPCSEIVTVPMDPDVLTIELAKCGLIANATSLGMKETDPAVLPADCIPAGCFVYDAIYQPPVTRLLADAAAKGCRTANGLAMLLHQGVLAFRIWFPGTEPIEHMRSGLASTR